MQTLIGVSLGLHILHHIVIVPGGHGAAAAGQADDHPLAADGVHRGGAQGGHEVAGGGVDVVELLALLGGQTGVFRLGFHQNIIVCDQSLFSVGQLVIGGPGGADGTGLAEVHRADGVDHGDDLLGGLGAVLLGFVFLQVIIRVVEHDHIALVEVLLCNAQVGVYAVEGVHPAGELSVGELSQFRAVLGGDGLNVVATFVLDVEPVANDGQDHIQHGGVVADRDLRGVDPGFQVVVSQRVLVAAVAVGGVAQQSEGHGNILARRQQHGDGGGHLGSAVGQRHGLLTTLVGVKAGDLHVGQIDLRGGAVRPGGGEYKAGQIQFVANGIDGLIIARDGQRIGHGLIADNGAVLALNPVVIAVVRAVQPRHNGAVRQFLGRHSLGEFIRICAEGVVLTAEIASHEMRFLIALSGADIPSILDGGVILAGRVHHVDGTDALLGPAVGQIVVVLYLGIFVQRAELTGDSADILAGGGKCTVEHIVADNACAVAPALEHAGFTAGNAAHIVLAFHAAADKASHDSCPGGVGGGISHIANAHDAARIVAGGDDLTGEGTAHDIALTHRLALSADQTTHTVHAVNGGGAGAVHDDSIEVACQRTDTVLILVAADDYILTNGAVADNDSVRTRSIPTQKAGLRNIGFPDDMAVFNGNGIGNAGIVQAVLAIVHGIV